VDRSGEEIPDRLRVLALSFPPQDPVEERSRATLELVLDGARSGGFDVNGHLRLADRSADDRRDDHAAVFLRVASQVGAGLRGELL